MTRYVTYKFPYGFMTLDRQTQQIDIDDVESAGEYLDKTDVTIAEFIAIKDNEVGVSMTNGELILSDPIPPNVLANGGGQ